jgi:Xaa-Pro aminopeptidase
VTSSCRCLRFSVRRLQHEIHQIERNLFIKKSRQVHGSNEAKSVAVFNSNDIYPISADSMPFAQHRDIFFTSR